jgi:transcriptional regulator with GAF, ATPase, and Fis domain
VTAPLTPEAAAKASAEDAKRVKAALKQASGNVSRAADALKVSVRNLHRRIATYGLRDWLTSNYPRGARQPKR